MTLSLYFIIFMKLTRTFTPYAIIMMLQTMLNILIGLSFILDLNNDITPVRHIHHKNVLTPLKKKK